MTLIVAVIPELNSGQVLTNRQRADKITPVVVIPELNSGQALTKVRI